MRGLSWEARQRPWSMARARKNSRGRCTLTERWGLGGGERGREGVEPFNRKATTKSMSLGASFSSSNNRLQLVRIASRVSRLHLHGSSPTTAVSSAGRILLALPGFCVYVATTNNSSSGLLRIVTKTLEAFRAQSCKRLQIWDRCCIYLSHNSKDLSWDTLHENLLTTPGGWQPTPPHLQLHSETWWKWKETYCSEHILHHLDNKL